MPDPVALPPLMRPTCDRPLAGLTVLVVEDSRYASEAMRLVCQASGARLRRADTLAAAWRHLRVYRPDVLVVDLGLPDGPGEALIADLARAASRPAVILGTSGDALAGPAALAAGADGFLEKPLPSISAFQDAVLALLPDQARMVGPRLAGPHPAPRPDPIALRDDLALAEDMLAASPDASARAYLARFLTGVARSAQDRPLAEAAERIGPNAPQPCGAEPGREAAIGRVVRLVRDRLAGPDPLWRAPAPAGPARVGAEPGDAPH